jgi:hypothetical protein
MAILAVWPFVYFWPVTLGQKVFIDRDIFQFFYPIRLELARRLAEGSIPLWNSGMDAGFPLFAEGQIAALYPPNIFLFRLLPIGFALSYSILLHFSWASLGMYTFCRSLGLRVASALLAGFVFSFSGFFLAHVQHLSLMATASWLPWLLYLQRQYQFARGENRRTWITWFALTSVAIALQFLSGFPQVSAMNLGVFILFAMLGTNAGESKKILSDLGAALMCIALGVGIAAVQLLPLTELISLSMRGQPIGEINFLVFSDPGELIQSVFLSGSVSLRMAMLSTGFILGFSPSSACALRHFCAGINGPGFFGSWRSFASL